MIIRRACDSDLAAVLRLAGRMWDEAPLLRDRPLDVDRVERIASHLIATDSGLVAEVDGEVIGFMGFVVAEDPWTGLTYASEEGLYVLPEYRRAGWAVSLVQAALKAVEARGAAWLDASVHTGVPGGESLYGGLQFIQSGTCYRKFLKPAPVAVG